MFKVRSLESLRFRAVYVDVMYYIINARRMRTRVTVLSLCVCVLPVCWLHIKSIQHVQHGNRLFARFIRFSTHRFV